MRDPNRLDNFYNELKELHKTFFPDWRFSQFFMNFCGWYGDPFYLEEDRFLTRVKDYIKVMGYEQNDKNS